MPQRLVARWRAAWVCAYAGPAAMHRPEGVGECSRSGEQRGLRTFVTWQVRVRCARRACKCVAHYMHVAMFRRGASFCSKKSDSKLTGGGARG
eukprot:365019-Chlamydomonas_euryale.AAC.18